MGTTCIALLSDFGLRDYYVAAMKGVILTINPTVQIVDVTHQIEPQNVRQGSLVLAQAAEWFPTGTIFVGVVDPGVGTERDIVCAEIDGRLFVAPDNGLLSTLGRKHGVARAVKVTRKQYFRQPVSGTFHGRDIMAPVAAHLSIGVPMDELGPPVADLVELSWPEPRRTERRVEGEVLYADHFGNVVTNVPREMLEDAPAGSVRVCGADQTFHGIRCTYAQVGVGEGAVLFGSSGLLEIAVREGSAAERFGLHSGDRVVVRW